MKKILYCLSLAAILAAGASCTKINDLEERVDQVETELSLLRGQAAELKSLIDQGFVITSIAEAEDGYILVMSNGQVITLKQGKDGKDGQDGHDGKDGKDGKDGSTLLTSITHDTLSNKVTLTFSNGARVIAEYDSVLNNIEQVVFIPEYNDGKATLLYSDEYNCEPMTFYFDIYPLISANTVVQKGIPFYVYFQLRTVSTRSVDESLIITADYTFTDGMLKATFDPTSFVKKYGTDFEVQLVLMDFYSYRSSEYIQVNAQKVEDNIMTFTALEPSTVELYFCRTDLSIDEVGTQHTTLKEIEDGSYKRDIEFSYDKKKWTEFVPGDIYNLDEQATMYIRGWNPDGLGYNERGFEEGTFFHPFFQLSGKIAAGGSIMSLVDRLGIEKTVPDSDGRGGCFFSLFRGQKALVKAPDLTAENLCAYCYGNTFKSCYELLESPVINAKKLGYYSLSGTFSFCRSLTKAPDLPSTQLADCCYKYLFYYCTSLTEAPALPAMELKEDCYWRMFCGCSALEEAPVLPAEKLVPNCYDGMFADCPNLKHVTALFTTDINKKDSSGEYNLYTSYWMENTAAEGVFVKNKDAEWELTGPSGIPEGWTVELQ